MTGSRPGQLPLPWPHRPSLRRDDFIVAPSNRLAIEAIDAWPNWPHPVLYVHGPEGAGKTHLAEAFLEASGGRDVRSLGGQEPERPFALAVEDIDRVAPVNETELFALVNAARLNGGTLLLTARVPPAVLRLGLPDLASRLRATTIVELGAPDDALLEGVLVKLFADRQLAVDQKLLAVILSRMERSAGAARDLVAEIDRASLATGRGISRGLVLDVLAGLGEGAARQD